MCKKYTNPVHCNHMTQYILNVTTEEWLKHLLLAFFGKFKSTHCLPMGHIVVT